MRKFFCLTLAFVAAWANAQNRWDYDTSEDAFAQEAVLDLRYLNEETAGQSGRIYREGDTLYLPDGTPVRFWGATTSSLNLPYQARFLAKMGVNLARLHGPKVVVNSETAQTYDETDPELIARIWEAHAAMREEGIYTDVSWYFQLSIDLQGRWGIPGYTEEWLAGAEEGDRRPVGSFFWERMFIDAYKQWARDLFGEVNTFTGLRMADDPAVAVIEMQNEDSLFFWTLNMARYPEVQRQKVEGLFYDWLVERYGSIELAQAAWGDFNAGTFGRDDFAAGRAEVKGASSMTSQSAYSGNTLRNRQRIADQVQFLTELQVSVYAEIRDFFREELGYSGLLIASNWKTADGWNLEDIERYTYTTADILDWHNYFNPVVYNGPRFPSAGSTWYSEPLVKFPQRSPVVFKQVEGYGSMVSETAWVNLFETKVEAPLIVAAMNSMNGLDMWAWFAMDRASWNIDWSQWTVGSPDMMGQFPAAALMVRRGDLDEGPAVVREGRSLETMFMRNRNVLPIYPGFDVTQDDPTVSPDLSGSELDPVLGFAGKLTLAFDTDEDFIHPQVPELIDLESKRLTSLTEEVTFDWEKGIFTMNSARTQGAVGFLGEERRITLDDVRITVENDLASIAVTAIDNRPLTQANQVLIQTATQAGLTGEVLEPWMTTYRGEEVSGWKAITLGIRPWQMRTIDGNVILFDERTIVDVKVLDTLGYYRESISPSAASGGQRIDLPPDAIYVVVEFEAPSNYTPVIYTKSMQNARVRQPFKEQLRAFDAGSTLTWSATGLPAGLSISAEGLVSGTPSEAGFFTPEVTVPMAMETATPAR